MAAKAWALTAGPPGNPPVACWIITIIHKVTVYYHYPHFTDWEKGTEMLRNLAKCRSRIQDSFRRGWVAYVLLTVTLHEKGQEELETEFSFLWGGVCVRIRREQWHLGFSLNCDTPTVPTVQIVTSIYEALSKMKGLWVPPSGMRDNVTALWPRWQTRHICGQQGAKTAASVVGKMRIQKDLNRQEW